MHGTLRFLYLSHLLYGICVNIFIMNRYISKSYTRSKNTIYRAGAAVVSTITSLYIVKTKEAPKSFPAGHHRVGTFQMAYCN